MIYISRFFGGLCNNLLQLDNAFKLFYRLKIDLNYLKINPKTRNPKYRNRNVNFLFKELEKHYIHPETDKIFAGCRPIAYRRGKPLPKINLQKRYLLSPILNPNADRTYNYLNILEKQKIIKEKYKDIADDNTITFHIRRGDYFYHKGYKKFILSDKYILNAIHKYSKNRILILTNPESIDYVKNLTGNLKNIIYAYDLNLNLDEEFLLGSVTNYVIMNPRSSFSKLLRSFNVKYLKDKKK